MSFIQNYFFLNQHILRKIGKQESRLSLRPSHTQVKTDRRPPATQTKMQKAAISDDHWRPKPPNPPPPPPQFNYALLFADQLSTTCRLIADVLRALGSILKTYRMYIGPYRYRTTWNKIPLQSRNIYSCIYRLRQSWHSVRDQSVSGREKVDNRLKSIKNPLPTSLVGVIFSLLMLQRKQLVDQNVLTPGRWQLATFRNPFYDRWQPSAEVYRYNVTVSIPAVCYCYPYANVHTYS